MDFTDESDIGTRIYCVFSLSFLSACSGLNKFWTFKIHFNFPCFWKECWRIVVNCLHVTHNKPALAHTVCAFVFTLVNKLKYCWSSVLTRIWPRRRGFDSHIFVGVLILPSGLFQIYHLTLISMIFWDPPLIQ